MRKKMYWGIGTLIILLLLGVTAVLLLRDTDTEPEVIYKTDVEPARKTETPIAEKPTARPGFEMVKHDDHWHEVPIDAPDTGQDQPHEPNKLVDHPVQTPRTFTGKLTYHKELLETHPVEAVRQQARELGHWSADHIPPFPPEDTEAAEFARALYLFRYYRGTGQTDHPDFQNVLYAQREMWKSIAGRDDKTPWEHARTNDLMKLVWPDLTGGAYSIPWTTTFTEGINSTTARPLLPFELEISNLGMTENN